jgi:hypothetical protein
MKILRFLLLAAPLGSLCAVGPAAAVPRARGPANLFHPTPREHLREMSTDRPDVTESPFTVDAGHAQLELTLASWTRDRHTPERSGGGEAWAFGEANLKLGLTTRMDFQIVAPLYTHERGGAQGFGDLTFRLKVNFWGNDGGPTAFGVMPFLKLPTAADGLGNDRVEGGLILPFAAELPAGWDFGTMLEVDWLADEAGSGYHADVIASVTFGHSIAGGLSGYLEFVSVLSEESDWAASFDCGLTYAFTRDIQLDAGINVGLTRAAGDLNPFLGLSIRF